jgi:CheY-like chemotaxis protein
LPAEETPVEVRPGSETILLVDDEPLVLRLTRDLLQRLGYTVLPAATGTEALDLCRDHPDRIDLAIVDMVMPGISGPELFQGLRAMDGDIRGLLSTGYDLADQAEHLFAQGFHGFIQKPFTLHTISLKLREILDKTGEPSLFRCQIP